MWKLTCLVSSAFLLIAPACGGDSSGDGGDGGDDSAAPFMCEYVEELCDPGAHEFCLRQFYPSPPAGSGGLSTAFCLEAPATCSDCDCAVDAVYAYLDGSNNCDGFIGCSQTNGEITVTCTNVPF